MSLATNLAGDGGVFAISLCVIKKSAIGITMGYQVLIDDNFHYQDESERVKHGVFATAEEALAACRAIVDGYLSAAFKPGMTADALSKAIRPSGKIPSSSPMAQAVRLQVLRLRLRPGAVRRDRRALSELRRWGVTGRPRRPVRSLRRC